MGIFLFTNTLSSEESMKHKCKDKSKGGKGKGGK